MNQKAILDIICSLEELDNVAVEVTGSRRGTVRISHDRHHGLEFHLRWVNDHFVGSFVDGVGAKSQAVVSLYSPMDAVNFVSAYNSLNTIRANQKAG